MANLSSSQSHFTPEEFDERELFILNRIRAGLSRVEIQRQYAQNYSCTVRNARNWYNSVCDRLWNDEESRQEKRRIKVVIVEMYHAQLTSAQSDIASVQQEIARITAIMEKKEEKMQFLSDVAQGLVKATPQEISRAKFELEMLPEIGQNVKGNLLEVKSRMRERLFKTMMELAKIQGVYQPDLSWMKAVEVLVDQDLLPLDVAQNILGMIDVISNPNQLSLDSGNIEREDLA